MNFVAKNTYSQNSLTDDIRPVGSRQFALVLTEDTLRAYKDID